MQRFPSSSASTYPVLQQRRPGASTRAIVALTFVALTAACAAQTPVTSPAPAPPPEAGQPLPPAPAAVRPPMPLQQTPLVQGTVSRFTINPEGDVDGFLLSDGTLVSFPPHMGSELVALVQPRDRVAVDGLRAGTGDVKARQIQNLRTGQQLVDQPRPPPDARRLPPTLRGAGLVKLTAQGTILHVTTAPLGEPDGVLLRDGTIIKLTPLAAQQFIDILKPETEVVAAGYDTRNQYGEALQATSFGTPGRMVNLYGSTTR